MKQFKRYTWLYLVTAIILATGCSLSEPRRAEADFGNSVRNMIAEQTYDPSAATRSAEKVPDGYDGQLGEKVIEVYHKDVSKPKKVTQPIRIQIGR